MATSTIPHTKIVTSYDKLVYLRHLYKHSTCIARWNDVEYTWSVCRDIGSMKWRHDIMWPQNWRNTWLGKREPLNLSHYCANLMLIGFVEVEIKRFHFVCDYNQRDVWLRKWEPLALSHHTTKFGGCRFCGSRDIVLLICCVTQQGNIVSEICPLILLSKKNFWK